MFLPTLHHVAQLPLDGGNGDHIGAPVPYGAQNVVAGFLCCRDQFISSEWSFSRCSSSWERGGQLLSICLPPPFTIVFQCLFSPSLIDGGGVGCLFQPWVGLQASTFPLLALICGVMAELWSCRGTHPTLVAPLSPDVVPGAPEPCGSSSSHSTSGAVLLRQLQVHRLHQNLHVLQLHGWSLDSAFLNT